MTINSRIQTFSTGIQMNSFIKITNKKKLKYNLFKQNLMNNKCFFARSYICISLIRDENNPPPLFFSLQLYARPSSLINDFFQSYHLIPI